MKDEGNYLPQVHKVSGGRLDSVGISNGLLHYFPQYKKVEYTILWAMAGGALCRGWPLF